MRYTNGAWIDGSTAISPRAVVRDAILHCMSVASLLVIENESMDCMFVSGHRRGMMITEPPFIAGYHAIFGGRFIDFNTMIELLQKRKKPFSLYDRDSVLLGTFNPEVL